MRRVLIGISPQKHHSYRDCEDSTDAVAFMWFLAHSPHPERAWMFCGLDGWMSNRHMASKPIPESLLSRVMVYFQNDTVESPVIDSDPYHVG